MKFYGKYMTTDYLQFIELNLLPCNYGLAPGEVPEDNPSCVPDLEKQRAFLEPTDIHFMYTATKVNKVSEDPEEII